MKEAGPDRSAFLPCGSGYQWYVSAEGVAGRDLARLTRAEDMQSPVGGMLPAERAAFVRRAYAEVRGDTIAVTAGRAALSYERELLVSQVLVVRPIQGNVCP